MSSERVLVLARSRRDAELTVEFLARERIETAICEGVAALCRLLPESGAAVVVDETLTPGAVAVVARELEPQPPWSDFPFVVVTAANAPPAADAGRWAPLGNVTLLERPLRVVTLTAAVRAALRARRRQYDARRAIESRDRFLAMLGHELRNPLGAIRLAAELLRRGDDDERHIAVVRRQTRNLGRLVDDLLDVARVTYGKVTLHVEPLLLCEVAAVSAQSLDEAFRTAGVSLGVDVPGDLRVPGDRVRLEQVFTNLLTNALKYTPRGGSVALEAEERDGKAVVTVTDSGIGIAPDLLEQVFELFAQADRSLQRSQGGLGIGLTLVRTLVTLHGGTVRAASAGIGKGTQLRIELPLAAAPRPSLDSSAPARAARPHPTRVVLVEDGEDIREMLKELLEMEGHSVWTAQDGPHGVERILEVKPDIAFVDIGLPGFDGYEVARRVRAEGAGTPLVALTGYGQQEDRRLAKAAGFDAHLAKPVDLEHIHSTMAGLVAD